MGSMDRLSGTLNQLISDMNHMSAEHDKGDIDVQINAANFAGSYGLMAQGINAMVNGHISVKKQAMACIKSISEGDLQAPLQAFPGKKAFINDTVEQLRSTIMALIEEMRHMSDEHEKGDIDVHIDVQRFHGSYRQIAQGINDMVDGHISVKKQAMACIRSFGEGDLSAPLAQFPGKKAFINENIEQLRANVQALIEDTRQISDSALIGKLEEPKVIKAREELGIEDRNLRDHEKMLLAKEDKLKAYEWKLDKKADEMREEILAEFQDRLDELDARETELKEKEEKWRK